MDKHRRKLSDSVSSQVLPSYASAGGNDLNESLRYAVACHQTGRFSEAEKAYREILKKHPKQFDCLHLLGVICSQKGDYREALRQIDRALTIEPGAAAAHANRAAALLQLKELREALASCDRAIALDPRAAEAFSTRAAVLIELRRFEEAVENCDSAIALKPGYAGAYNNRGTALKDLKRRDEALASYDRAIALNAGNAEAHNNRGNVLNQLRRFGEALVSCERAIALNPDMAEAHFNRGIALDQLQQPGEAPTRYDQAIALKPDYAEAWSNRGGAYLGLQRYDEALTNYERAIALDPEVQNLRGMHLRFPGDWKYFNADRARLNSAVAAGNAASPPFQFAAFSSDPAIQLQCAKLYVNDRYAPFPAPRWRGELYSHPRIRLAYLSSDFRDHPVSHQTIGVFERHDRSRFETTAISYGSDSPSPILDRLKATFDRFIDARTKTGEDVARIMRELEIDIAIDLNGFTDGGRPEVLVQRPAPVQVNYLGFPGTLGPACWDYIIADRFVIPEDGRRNYGEKVVHLPDSFMANDSGRRISARTPTRSEVGLPESGFVFCCFNNAYKLTPDMFDVWMRLLKQVEGSVLWLSAANRIAVENLRGEAEKRGVAPDRLVFAPRVPLNEDHLARLRLADLFLDTRYYNAHATAADALWVGVPVLTCAGSTFAARVAGSLLHAVGLSELVTTSVADYEALALKLARDPALLSELRQKLASNRTTHPLFDTERFTRHLESAYTTMWERTQRRAPPASFAVARAG